MFAGCVLAQLLPLVALRHLATTDGPAHLSGAVVLAHYYDHDAALFRHFYSLSAFPSPNLLTEAVLATLVHLVSPAVADKLVVGGYLLLFPLALRYAVRSVDPRAGWLAFAAFPFTANYLLFYGFYNFCYALALSLLVAGFALRHRAGWRPRSVCALGGLLVLTYATHLVPTVVAMVFLATVAGVDAWSASRPRGSKRWRAAARRLVAPPALATLPVLALLAAFVARGGSHSAPQYKSLTQAVTGLGGLFLPIVTFVPAEALFAALTAVTLGLLVVVAVGRSGRPTGRQGRGALAVAAAAVTALYFVTPDQFGGEYGLISARLSFFPPLFLVLWLAASTSRRAGRLAAVVFVLAAVGLALVRLPGLLRYDRQLSEYETVARVLPPQVTVVALRLFDNDVRTGSLSHRNGDPLTHASGLVAADRRAVDVGHYEAEYNYFPTRFRPSHDLRRLVDPWLNGLERVPPQVLLPSPASAQRDPIDYVLVVGATRMPARLRDDPTVRTLLASLGRDYRPVFVSRPTRLVEVFARR